MSRVNKYIDWIVALAVTYITTFAVLRGIIGQFIPGLTTLLYVLHICLALSLIIYHSIHRGFTIINKGLFAFFLIYLIYILLYVTILRALPLAEMEEIPKNFNAFIFYYFPLFCYFFSAETIIEKFDVTKFLVISFLTCTIPSIGYIMFIGVDTLQIYGIARDEETLSWLTISYANLPLLIMGIFYIDKIFSAKWLSILFSIIVVLSTLYILLMATRRGPILFAIIVLLLCFQYKHKASFTVFFFTLLIVGFLIMNIDNLIEAISKIAPQTAERLDRTIYEGYTNGRFDDGAGTYDVGYRQVETSPIFGSYFRITSGSLRGSYPHNIFVEILMTMGWLGFVPFAFFIIKTIRNVIELSKSQYSTKYLAIIIIFLSTFFMLQTSGTIVVSTSFWLFFYILSSPAKYLRIQEKKKFIRA